MGIAQRIQMSEKEFKTLTSWSLGHGIATRVMKRAKIVLMATQEQQNKKDRVKRFSIYQYCTLDHRNPSGSLNPSTFIRFGGWL